MVIDAKKRFLIRAAESGNTDAIKELYNLTKEVIGNSDYHIAGKIYLDCLAKYSPPLAMKVLHPEFNELGFSKWK